MIDGIQNLTPEEALAAIVVALGVCIFIRRKRRKKSTQVINDDPLDRVLLHWGSSVDEFRVRDLLAGGILWLGRPGSGKTSSSGKEIGHAIVADPHSTMLILCAKQSEDVSLWKGIFADQKRSGELFVFDEKSGFRFDPFDYAQRKGASSMDVTRLLLTSAEVVKSGDRHGTSSDAGEFFQAFEERNLYGAVSILRHAKGRVAVADIRKFITTAAMSPEQLRDETWRKSFHNQSLIEAHQREKSPEEQHDLDVATDTWLIEWPRTSEKTRSTVLAGLLNKLFYFDSGLGRKMFSGETNCSPDDVLEQGKSIAVDFPPSIYGDFGKLAGTIWKCSMQMAVLRRTFRPGQFYNIVWADEAWQFVTSADSFYGAQARSRGGALCYLAQSRHSFYSALKGESGKEAADALISQFHTRILHALGSPDDAAWASSLIGRSRQMLIGGSMGPPGDTWDQIMGTSSGFNANFNETIEETAPTHMFMNNLKCGGKANGLMCDCIVLKNGEPFPSTGQCFKRCTFRQ